MKRDERRKNEWKYAQRRRQIFIDNIPSWVLDSNNYFEFEGKPLHYYAKNPPWDSYAKQPNKTNNKGSRRYISKNYRPNINWKENDKRKIDSLNDQLEDLDDSGN